MNNKTKLIKLIDEEDNETLATIEVDSNLSNDEIKNIISNVKEENDTYEVLDFIESLGKEVEVEGFYV